MSSNWLHAALFILFCCHSGFVCLVYFVVCCANNLSRFYVMRYVRFHVLGGPDLYQNRLCPDLISFVMLYVVTYQVVQTSAKTLSRFFMVM